MRTGVERITPLFARLDGFVGRSSDGAGLGRCQEIFLVAFDGLRDGKVKDAIGDFRERKKKAFILKYDR